MINRGVFAAFALMCNLLFWNCLQLVRCMCKMPPAKHQINLYYTHQSCTLYT